MVSKPTKSLQIVRLQAFLFLNSTNFRTNSDPVGESFGE